MRRAVVEIMHVLDTVGSVCSKGDVKLSGRFISCPQFTHRLR